MDPGVVARFVHLTASLALVGALAMPLVAGRSDRPTARAWLARVRRLAGALAVATLVGAVALLLTLVATLEGDAGAVLDGGALARVLLDTHAGVVWLVRASVLLLLAAFLILAVPTGTRSDWIVAHGEALLLGGLALALTAAGGHAAAVEPAAVRAVAVDALHLVAAGVWLGGLVPLAMLLRTAGVVAGEDARAYAVLAARRFSRVALSSVLVLVATGIGNSVTQVGNLPALVGTRYGRLLLVKLALIVPLVALGALNRRRWLPALSGDAVTLGRPTMRRLARSVAFETVLGLGVLAVVAGMTSTPPARHVEPTWPFPFRLSWSAADASSQLRTQVLLASQLAVLGVATALAALILVRHRRPLLIAGLALLTVGAGAALPPLAVDAYPTTFRRAAIPYTASSIASGLSVFESHCARCHPVAAVPDPFREASRLGRHTAGDIFWWISRGVPGTGMPPFAPTLSEEARWDVVNVVRALDAARQAASLAPTVSETATVVAPDFSFAVGPASPHTLREYRGTRAVLLVLYTLPGSRPRLAQLAEAHRLLGVLGVEIIAVPTDAAPDAIARIGDTPRVLFPVVTSGAADILRAYRLFGAAPHAEFLIDRQGYIRARWTASEGAAWETNLLLADVQQLNEEQPAGPPPDEHVH